MHICSNGLYVEVLNDWGTRHVRIVCDASVDSDCTDLLNCCICPCSSRAVSTVIDYKIKRMIDFLTFHGLSLAVRHLTESFHHAHCDFPIPVGSFLKAILRLAYNLPGVFQWFLFTMGIYLLAEGAGEATLLNRSFPFKTRLPAASTGYRAAATACD